MRLQGQSRADVAAVTGYSLAWVDKWSGRYAQGGAEGLRVGYTGSLGLLTPDQRAEIQVWLKGQAAWSVSALAAYIEAEYGVRYQSDRSYHSLLNAARLSWKKAQHAHPEPDPEAVAETRETIKKNAVGRSGPDPETACAAHGG
jgi:transposase